MVEMVRGIDFHRQEGETAEGWLGRLRSIDWEALSMTQRIDLSHSKDLAEKAAKKEGQPLEGARTPEPLQAQMTPLQLAKEAYLGLSQVERRQFSLWLTQQGPGK